MYVQVVYYFWLLLTEQLVLLLFEEIPVPTKD